MQDVGVWRLDSRPGDGQTQRLRSRVDLHQLAVRAQPRSVRPRSHHSTTRSQRGSLQVSPRTKYHIRLQISTQAIFRRLRRFRITHESLEKVCFSGLISIFLGMHRFIDGVWKTCHCLSFCFYLKFLEGKLFC